MFTTPPHIRSVVDQDGAVILDIKRDAMLTLNATGSYFWQRLQQGALLDEIVRDLARDTGSDVTRVECDVREFVEQLKSRQVLTADPLVELEGT
jgi:Coenzyme PQQ synthesis protein D (PqqD)